MTIQNIKSLALIAMAAVALLASPAVAQDHVQTQTSQMQVRMLPPSGGGGGYYGQPRLGIHGQMLYGRGMKILSVNYDSGLRQVGAEYGDIIEEINGRPIRTLADYRSALLESVMYRGFLASIKIHNVRFGYEYGAQEHVYVTVRVQIAGGYPMPVSGGGGYPMPMTSGGGNAGIPYGGIQQTPGGGVISETPATSDGSAAQGDY